VDEVRIFIRSFRPILFFSTLVIAILLVIFSAFPDYYNAAASENASATVDSENSLIVHIEGTVESPGDVIIEYGSKDTGTFTTRPVPSNDTAFSIQVMRLRAGTTYDYRVFLLNSSGDRALQFEGSFTTGPLPPGLQNARFELIQGRPTYGLTLLDFNDSDFNGIVAIDQDASVIWYYEHDKVTYAIDQKENFNLVFNEISQVNGYTLTEIAPDGSIVNSIDDTLDDGSVCQPHGRWHHEVILRPDNRVWTLGSDVRMVNINGEDRLQSGTTIDEWDITAGTVTRLVSMFDIMDAATERTEYSNVTTGFFWIGCENEYQDEAEDWVHSNSIDVTANGRILVSHRHLNQIIAIEPDFSQVAWRLGGPKSDFTFPEPSDQFWHQHTAKELPNGNILLFDNGNFRPEDQGGAYSRALELELNFETMEARKVWEYRHDPDLYAPCCSSVHRLENGNTVLVFGRDEENNPGIFTLVEADPEGNAVAVTEISSEGKDIQYRAYPIDSINGEKANPVLPQP
jgi:hypothetical protein